MSGDEGTEPVEPEPATRVSWRRIGVAATAAVAVGLIAAALWIAAPLFPPISAGFATTTGRIYVESPEVYTRERLVNDRYRQDFWLRAQLDALDASDALIGSVESSRLDVGSRADRPAAAAGAETAAVAFREEFLLRSALRDKIRQLVLENLLDDRHDLTGNSIYGLKFDTGIIPGANTHLRPYVKVRLALEDAAPEEALASPRFLIGSQPARDDDRQSAFERTKRQFVGWTTSLQGRLRAYVDSRWMRSTDAACTPGGGADVLAAKAPPAAGPVPTEVAGEPLAAGALKAAPAAFPAPPAARSGSVDEVTLIKEALQYVMGIDPREVTVARPAVAGGKSLVALPGAWGQFFELWVDFDPAMRDAGGAPFLMQLEPFFVTVHLVRLQDWEHFRRNASDGERLRFWHAAIVRLPEPVSELTAETAGEAAAPAPDAVPPASDWAVLVPSARLQGQDRYTPSPQDLAFIRGLTQDDLERIQRWMGPRQGCVAPGDGIRSGCLLPGQSAAIDAPIHRFVKERGRTDAYSYAVFPRGDVDGILSERRQSAAIPDVGVGELTTGLAADLRTLEARADPIVVNFANDEPASGDVEFGWAVVAPGQQRPRQVSQMVLVSVPAYLERLDLEVETGWLDRNSDEMQGAGQISAMSVSLPTDFEALDTLVARGARREGPAIDQSRFDPAYCGRQVMVQACAAADILIPGARLWRSTTVTLGGQQADQITVTPDMQGIVASFGKVHWPLGPADAAGRHTLPLVVWTSEGSDSVRSGVAVAPAEPAGSGVDCGR